MKAGKPIIGVAGGIGSGKSTVASILSEFGAGVIDSDRLNREELSSPEVVGQLRAWWGPKVIGPDGQVDRGAVRRLVTGDTAARQQLEGLMHPRIARRSQTLLSEYLADPDVRAVVWDAPLLFEAKLAGLCDRVIFVEADERLRQERVLAARGWTPQEFRRLEQLQSPLEAKRRESDYAVVNDCDQDALRERVREIFRRILATHQGE